MSDPLFLEPTDAAPSLTREIATDVPFPPELAALVDAHPDQHDFAAAPPAVDDVPVWTTAEKMEAAGAAFLEAPERDEEHDQAVPAPVMLDVPPCHNGDDQCPEHRIPAPPPDAPPQPMWAGTYAVYDDGRGGVVLVLGQSTGQTLHHHIPAGLIKMAERFGGGGIAKMFGAG